MAYPAKLLQPHEEVVFDLNPHWKYLVAPTATLIGVTLLGILAGINTDSRGVQIVLGIAILVAIGWWVQRFVVWRSTSFILTTDRIISRSGVLKTSGVEIPLERINTVFFEQTLLERLIGSGDLAIESGGETGKEYFRDIVDPPEVQHEIYTQMENNEARKYDRIGKGAAEGARSGVHQTHHTGPLTVAEQLEKLAELHSRGVLSDEEFAEQKARLLS